MNVVIRSLPDVPVLARDKGSGSIEEILAIMKIEDRKMAPGPVSISGRRVNDEVALIAKKARAELFVFAELSRTHGAIVTRRSFASTCCPEVTSSFTTLPEIGA